MKEGQFRLDIIKFFIMNVIRHCNKLPREVGDTSTLETFEVQLDGAQIHLMSLPIAEGLN